MEWNEIEIQFNSNQVDFHVESNEMELKWNQIGIEWAAAELKAKLNGNQTEIGLKLNLNRTSKLASVNGSFQ